MNRRVKESSTDSWGLQQQTHTGTRTLQALDYLGSGGAGLLIATQKLMLEVKKQIKKGKVSRKRSRKAEEGKRNLPHHQSATTRRKRFIP